MLAARCRGELALREGKIEAAVDAHDLAGGAHLRAEDGIDLGKALEGEDGFLDADMLWAGASSG